MTMIKRIWILFLAGVALLLSACGSNSTATPAPTSTATAEPAPTSGSANLGASLDVPGCTVSSPFPTPGPTERSLFPPEKDTDWSVGPENAAVTIIEYSDFQ
jgi:hypothetical protein